MLFAFNKLQIDSGGVAFLMHLLGTPFEFQSNTDCFERYLVDFLVPLKQMLRQYL
jgi:hypothetical protein